VADGDERAPAPSLLTDAELVDALRTEDTGAPAILWERYSPAVRRLLMRALGPGVDIDDLTQEVFLRVFVRLPSLREASALRPFILAVAANVLKWELRRRWVSRRVRLSDTGTLPDIEGRPEDMEARQALRRCYTIFETLTAKERIAFVLRYMELMTVNEVAATLSVSTSTAKRWVNRAAARVAEHVARDPGLRSFFGDPHETWTHES
jgi:RNA polymerase sigma-70 factor, ECF subfamily